MMDTAGRVERFKRRYEKQEKAKEQVKAKETAKK